MSHTKLIIILLIVILIIITITLLLLAFRKCPEPSIYIKELIPKNQGKSFDLKTIKIIFNGKLEEKEVSFEVKPELDLDINFSKSNNTTVILNGNFSPGTDYTITIKSRSRCSRVKELTQGSYSWQFKTATEEELINNQDKEEDKLYEKNPLLKYLPHKTADFQIIFIEGPNVYQITLYAILNNPNQVDSYKQELKQYKTEALDWIQSKEVDPATLKIKWLPEPDPDNPKI